MAQQRNGSASDSDGAGVGGTPVTIGVTEQPPGDGHTGGIGGFVRGLGERIGGSADDASTPRKRTRRTRAQIEADAATVVSPDDVSAGPRKSHHRRTGGTEIPAEALTGLYLTAGAVLAARYGDHWQFDPQEASALSEKTAAALRHVPLPTKQVGVAVDLLALAAVASGIIGPRVMITRDQRRNGGRFAEWQAAQRNGTPPPAPAPAGPYTFHGAGLEGVSGAINPNPAE